MLAAYVINVHGMKSALANIGETDLSSLASKLEQAGREGNSEVMSSETPKFLNALRAVIEKITPKDEEDSEDYEITDEDRAYLREKLRTLQAACAEYNKNAAKDVLSEIEQKTWPRKTRKWLDAIAAQLLHSKFKAIINAVDELDSHG
jgi:HPt (histidine-containing phosphotransfer) domain-containing protein